MCPDLGFGISRCLEALAAYYDGLGPPLRPGARRLRITEALWRPQYHSEQLASIFGYHPDSHGPPGLMASLGSARPLAASD
jgi:hypothetical protein